MRFSSAMKRALLSAFAFTALSVAAQDSGNQSVESKGLPPRATPGDYQAQGKAGSLTIAAEFVGHSVPTPEAIYTSDDYVVVEIGLFGPSPASIAPANFSLRINGTKKTLAAQPYEMAFKTMMDPEWQPPKQEEKPKTSFGGGGQGGQDSGPPPPVHMPMEIRRPMEQRVTRAAMLEGELPLPRAGLVFFEFHSKAKNIRSVDLIYSGAAGNATIVLHP
jgi:hypothetical protein